MRPRKDLKGQVFFYLTAVEYIGDSHWRCQCKCGNETEVKTNKLIAGIVKSCGCYRKYKWEIYRGIRDAT